MELISDGSAGYMGQLILLRFFLLFFKTDKRKIYSGFRVKYGARNTYGQLFFLPSFSGTGGLAQTVERSLCMREALGSILRFSILFPL